MELRVAVIGLGYIGLPTALLLARAGVTVFGFDTNQEKISHLQAGELPFVETGLPELFAAARAKFFPVSVLPISDIYIICVPTPVTGHGTCDDSYVRAAAESIGPLLKRGDTMILESTVAPGTTEGIVGPILEKAGLKIGSDLSLAYVSEKAIPGNTIHEMIHNVRIIGGVDERSQTITRDLYARFVTSEICLTNCKTAEMVKLVENTYRDVNIAFANELAAIAPKVGVNVWEVIRLANKHPRVAVHQPGPGVGGHCIALDPWFLIQQDPAATKFMQRARERNDSMPQHVGAGADTLAKKYASRTIGILGVAYKKNVDDARETPALPLIQFLQDKGYTVLIHDPLVKHFSYPLSPLAEVLAADGLILVTDHEAYRDVPDALSGRLYQSECWLLDTRGLFEQNPPIKNYYLLGNFTV